MHRLPACAPAVLAVLLWVCGRTVFAPACSDPDAVTHDTPYEVIEVKNPGAVTGRVVWARATPEIVKLPVGKNPEACGGHGAEKILPRLKVGPDKGVKDTVVFLNDVAKGKPFPAGVPSRLDQRQCEYVPHVMILPKGASLEIASGDDVLHTVHMTGALGLNLAFPGAGARPSVVTLNRAGLIEVACDNGHAWMSASIVVVTHPYYALTDEHGSFTLDGVPPATYELVAWHEGWEIEKMDQEMGVVKRYAYSRPVIKKQPLEVKENGTAEATFELGWR